MKVKVKKLTENAVIPKQMTIGAAGFDLTATSKVQLSDDLISYGTGLAFEIPEGYFMLIAPRSSIFKKEMILSNSMGIVDSDFRGEVKFIYRINPGTDKLYEVGERIGQAVILPYPQIEFQEVIELTDTERGNRGYGSTGA